jgi:fatty-acyl-CoA synthase
MGIQYSAQEREAHEARARAILDERPDVLRLIARGAALAGPDHEALVYLRTAMDPAPAVTTARDFLGLLTAAVRWFRVNGVGPEDTISIFVPHCTAMAIAYWAAMSFATVHPLNLLFSREAIVAQLKAARAKILFAPPLGAPERVVREGRGPCRRGSDARAGHPDPARRQRRLRRRSFAAGLRL